MDKQLSRTHSYRYRVQLRRVRKVLNELEGHLPPIELVCPHFLLWSLVTRQSESVYL